MRSLRVLLVLWFLLLAGDRVPTAPLGALTTGGRERPIAPPALVPGQLLLGFLPEIDEAARDALIAAHGGATIARLDTLDARLVAVRGARPLGEVARAFAAGGGVRYAEPNAVARVSSSPNDPRLGEQWALRKIGVMDNNNNWLVPTGDRSIVVGVVDSGVNYAHLDLAANIWSAPAGWSLDGCAVGTHGYSAINGVQGCDPRDELGTGTQVAGVIGAVGNNGIGISGVNQQVSMMALKCVDSNGFVQMADAVKVIDYAIAAKAAGVDLRVLSIGWTARTFSISLRDVIAAAGEAGILVVAAAGDAENNNDKVPQYPASFGTAPYNFPHVIAVLATDQNDARRLDMGYGASSVQLAAPGIGVLTTTNGGVDYAARASSALAAAHVAGGAALVIAATPGRSLSIATLRSRLLACGDPVLDLASVTTTGRRLNVARTLANTDCAFTLTTAIAGNAMSGRIAVEPDQPTYPSGTTVALTAIPAEGYRFDSWEIDGQAGGNATQRSLTIDADRIVIARFVRRTYSLTINLDGNGTVTAAPSSPGGVYDSGTTVRLTATPYPGFQFTGWTLDGNAAGIDATVTVLMDKNRVVRASFGPIASPPPSPVPLPSPSPTPRSSPTPQPSPTPSPALTYPLTLTATAGGTAAAVPGGGAYLPNTRVALSATSAVGYVFTGWTIDGSPAGRANPYTITMTTARRAVANFAPAQTLNLSYTSGGRVDASAATWDGDSPYPLGTTVTLTATTASNGVFTGWTIDGVFAGWANPLTLTMDRPHAVVATFAGRPRFGDLPPGPPPYEAISQLAARGIIHGYENGDFGPHDTTLRAQMAALIVRAMGWEGANPPNPFGDRNGVDDELWRAIAILAARDVARGYGDGTYGTTDPVLQVQTISFITRAMIRAGRWEPQPDNPALFPQIPRESGHREDLSTYVHYVGAPPGADSPAAWAAWDTPSARGWFAQALWQALDGYYNVDRVP